MRWTCFECSASDWRFKILCYAHFSIYRSSWRKLLHICFEFHKVIEYMRGTCSVSTASDSCFKMLCYADFNIHRSSRRKCVTYLFCYVIEYMRWTPLSVLLVIRVLICFVTLTITYTAQVDENVLHICFYYHYVIEYMRWTFIDCTASDSCFKMLCYADFNIHRSSRRKCVTYLFLFSLCYWVYALNSLCTYN